MYYLLSGAGIYLTVGLLFSLTAAPMSWHSFVNGQRSLPLNSDGTVPVNNDGTPQRLEDQPLKHPLGNIPFWLLAWPVPLAAQGVKAVTGKYPSWTPWL